MAKMTTYFDPVLNTLNLWWGDKKDAVDAKPVKNPNRDDVIVYDKNGNPISLELIGFLPEELEPLEQLPIEKVNQLIEKVSKQIDESVLKLKG